MDTIILSMEEIKKMYPESLGANGGIDFEKLAVSLIEDIADLQDQLAEKDYQILHIMDEIDALKKKII